MKQLQILLLFALCSFGACQSGETSDQETQAAVESGIFERLNVANFQTKLATTQNPQLIDVRTPEEFEKGAIIGAMNMNYHDKNFLMKTESLDKNSPVFLYCQAGGRSLKSAKKLQTAGFKEIYELEVGYSGWEH